MTTTTFAPHTHGPLDGCCGERGTAVRSLADRMLGTLRTQSVPELLAAGPDREAGPGARRADRADVLVVGSIATGDPTRPVVGAMGVKDGRVVALGSVADLEGLRGTGTELVEGGDGVIIPGLIEPHMHLWSTGVFYGMLDCSHASNPRFDDLVARLQQAVAGAAPGAWVCGELFDPSLYPGEPDLTADILDRVSTEHPIAVMNASMHYAYVNSKAFELTGITAQTPDPPNGVFHRADGRLTGVVGELGGMMAIITATPQKSTEELASSLVAIMNEAASRGVTSMREAMTGQLRGPDEVAMLHQMNAASRLPTRLSLAQSAVLGHQLWADAGIVPFGGDEMVRTDAWKLIADGSNQGRSAFLRTPYLGGMGGVGAANFGVEELTARIREGHEAGWQVMVHANGDAAVDRVLTAYEGALRDAAPHDLRHRIEHCSLARPEHFSRMARSAISPSFLNAHVYYWGRVLRDNILGPERAAGLHAVQTAVRNGLRPSLHSDYNVSPINPLLAARTAVLRQVQDGGDVLGPDERVDAETALRAITVDAAWQIHRDDCGSLGIGQMADFAIASENPWTTEPEAWGEITFSETRLGGQVAWQR